MPAHYPDIGKALDDLDFPPRVQAYLPAPQALPRVPLKMLCETSVLSLDH
jgi:hypothetical protein